MIRTLSKRDPYSIEMHDYRLKLENVGKKGLIEIHKKLSSTNSIVHDIVLSNVYNASIEKNSEINQVIWDFRNITAGGRIARNNYLLSKRNIDRLWIKLKNEEELLN
jgi:hypothetical protein